MGPFLSIFCSSSTHTTVDSPTPVRTTETKCEDNFDDWFEIGEGGYGRVFRALDKRTGETVAIKKIDLAKVDAYVEEEVLNLAKCLHPQIVQFKEVFITRDYLAISMQFCNGGDLYSYLHMRKTHLPENMARWFFQQLIVAVDYCHTWLNVSNRDLKLENLLLDFEDLSVRGEELPDVSKWPIIKICGFGASRNRRDQSPENIAGTEYDAHKSDIWSAGVVLFLLCTMEHPFLDTEEGRNQQEITNFQRTFSRIMAGDYTFPAGVPLTAAVKDLIRMIFQVNPDERITMDGIFRHPWFQKNLPEKAAERQYGIKEDFTEIDKSLRDIVRSANPQFKWRY